MAMLRLPWRTRLPHLRPVTNHVLAGGTDPGAIGVGRREHTDVVLRDEGPTVLALWHPLSDTVSVADSIYREVDVNEHIAMECQRGYRYSETYSMAKPMMKGMVSAIWKNTPARGPVRPVES